MWEIFSDIQPAIDCCASAQQQHKHGHKCTHARLRFVLTTVISRNQSDLCVCCPVCSSGRNRAHAVHAGRVGVSVQPSLQASRWSRAASPRLEEEVNKLGQLSQKTATQHHLDSPKWKIVFAQFTTRAASFVSNSILLRRTAVKGIKVLVRHLNVWFGVVFVLQEAKGSRHHVRIRYIWIIT